MSAKFSSLAALSFLLASIGVVKNTPSVPVQLSHLIIMINSFEYKMGQLCWDGGSMLQWSLSFSV